MLFPCWASQEFRHGFGATGGFVATQSRSETNAGSETSSQTIVWIALQQTSAVERGKQTYVKVGCYQCHGREAQGASTGPRLGPNPLPLAAFTRAIRTPRNEMPPYSAKLLSDAALADVYAFVAARPRPHELSE